MLSVAARQLSDRFSVKKNAPVRRPRSVYPFEEMVDVGDYFDAPDDMGWVLGQEGKSARRHSILSSARNFAKRHKTSFKVSTTIWYDKNVAMVRCQRVDAAPPGEVVKTEYEVHSTSKSG